MPMEEDKDDFILFCSYGPKDITSWCRKTYKKAKYGKNVYFPASNKKFGDTWPGNDKVMVVVHAYKGKYMVNTCWEGKKCKVFKRY